MRNLIEEAGRSHYRPTPSLVGRPSAAAANVMRLDSHHNQHWPAKHKNNILYHVCSERCQRKQPYTNVPNVMWVCAWCRVLPITTQTQICKAVFLQARACVCVCVCARVHCVVTEERLKVPQNLCSIQNYVCNKIFTLHFINCMQ